jgi:hypothetical protein
MQAVAMEYKGRYRAFRLEWSDPKVFHDDMKALRSSGDPLENLYNSEPGKERFEDGWNHPILIEVADVPSKTGAGTERDMRFTSGGPDQTIDDDTGTAGVDETADNVVLTFH